jgi:predicted lipoprotein
MKKTFRYLLFLLVIAFVAYNSVYFKKLDEVKAGTDLFNGRKFAANFWSQKLTPALAAAPDAALLFDLLKTDSDQAFSKYGKSMSIGNIKYFLVNGRGIVRSVEENQVIVDVNTKAGSKRVVLATEYIFGNAVRDASGQIDINDFGNSSDLNAISAELNQIIRNKVLPSFLAKVKNGDEITFSGALELNQKYPDLAKIEIIPIRLSINDPSETKPE